MAASGLDSIARGVARAASILAFAAVPAAAAPAAGDGYTYRVSNMYNNEVWGKADYRVERIEAGRVVIAFATDVLALGVARTEVYTDDGNGLALALINHDRPVAYEFASPLPAYQFPLDPGKSWSMRVGAVNAQTGKRVNVRVDGDVAGTERISTPAGSFDTIRIKRSIYAGDWDGFRFETNIVETEWYAPALGRAVRLERNSSYFDQQRCSDEMSACRPARGDWVRYELTEARTAQQ